MSQAAMVPKTLIVAPSISWSIVLKLFYMHLQDGLQKMWT